MKNPSLLPFMAALMLCSLPLPTVFANPATPTAHKSADSGPKLPVITTKDLKAKFDRHETITLVEALEPKYYDQWHLPGAICMTEPEKTAAQLLPDKKAEIVVYCMNVY